MDKYNTCFNCKKNPIAKGNVLLCTECKAECDTGLL